MDSKTFIRKALSPWVWINIILMTCLILGLVIGVWTIMDDYTNHGQKQEVPKIKGMNITDAKKVLKSSKLKMLVIDSSYSKKLPDGMILNQMPSAGKIVKPGRAIEVTVNTHASPTLPVPDIINNCSKREAEQRLSILGFKLDPCEYIAGQRDYVLGLKSEGKLVKAGDLIKTEKPVTLVLGSGTKDGHVDTTQTYPTKTQTQKAKTPEEEDKEVEDAIIEEIL